MRLQAVITVLVAGGMAAGLLTGCSSSSSPPLKAVLPVNQRREPIEMSGTTLEGSALNLATLRGKPVVLNIWGSWCPPCAKEAPAVQAAATELGDKVSFVGVDIGDDAVDQAQAFQRHFNLTYPSLVDKGDLLLALHGSVPAQSPPVTLVLDAQGRIAARFVGPITKVTLVDMVNDVSKA
jgi:thiol-disulfide isomerase/thioredoxin